MGCDCGKPKCDGHCGVSPAVLQINNPSECVLFHKRVIPASLGDSKTNPPKNGEYKNVLLYYEADQTSWLYLSDGIPTRLTNGLTDYEDAINLPQINGVTLLGNKSLGDLGITDAIDDSIAEEKAEREAADEALGDEIDTINDELLSRAVVFDTVADMKASTDLKDGMAARTLGFHSVNDGGGSLYRITNSGTANEMDVVAVGDLYANLVLLGDIKPELFGAYGDGTHNDSAAFNRCLNYTFGLQSTLNNEVIGRDIVLTKDYLIDRLSIPQGMAVTRIIGKKARIRTGGFTFNASTGWKVRIEGITFDHCATPIDLNYRNLEYGRYEIINCIFNGCSGVCCNIERRSCQAIIDGCTFRGCEKSVYVNNVDMFIFKNNWVECTSAYPWGNNHYDIEQYAPDEGSMFIENNMFIPGHTQTGTNPCWIKVGRNAIIKNNRFSGENTSIHPVIIDYDRYASFNVNSTIYPIVDIEANPIMTGNTVILVAHACGQINITSNSGWAGGGAVLRTTGDDANTYFTNLDYKWLSIVFRDNGGRTFNFKDDYGTGLPAAYKPTVDALLQRFIKDKPLYQDEYNYELKASVTNYVLDIEYCTTNLKRVNTIVISGTINKNPAGTDYYEPFIALLTLERYYDTELRYRGHAQIITKNNQNVSLDVLVNGQAYITALPSSENVKFTVSGNGSARPEFKSVEMLHFKPITNSLSN